MARTTNGRTKKQGATAGKKKGKAAAAKAETPRRERKATTKVVKVTEVDATPISAGEVAPVTDGSTAWRMVATYRAAAQRLVESHDRAATKRTRFDSIQSFRKVDRFLLKAVSCYLTEGERATLETSAPWVDLLTRYRGASQAKAKKSTTATTAK